MKKYILISALTVGSYLMANCQTMYPSGVNGCIARWTFDTVDVQMLTSLTDSSGNNHHGSITDVASTNGFRNKVHAAGRFNGQTSFAQVFQNTNQLCPQNLSVLALIKFNAFNMQLCQGNNIIYNGFSYNNAGGNWAFFVSDMGDCNTFSPQTESLKFQGSNQQQTSFNPNNTFIDSTSWYFLATAHNNQGTTYYIEKMDPLVYNNNVQAKYTVMEYNPIGNQTFDVMIGKTNNPPYPYFLNADIDELILFNRDLAQSEIQSVYQYLWGYVNALEPISAQHEVKLTWQGQTLYLNDPQNSIQHLELFSASGACLLNTKATSIIQLNSPLSAGVYYVRLRGKNGQAYFHKVCVMQ